MAVCISFANHGVCVCIPCCNLITVELRRDGLALIISVPPRRTSTPYIRSTMYTLSTSYLHSSLLPIQLSSTLCLYLYLYNNNKTRYCNVLSPLLPNRHPLELEPLGRKHGQSTFVIIRQNSVARPSPRRIVLYHM